MNIIEKFKYSEICAKREKMAAKVVVDGQVWLFHGCFYQHECGPNNFGKQLELKGKSTFVLRWDQSRASMMPVIKAVAKANGIKRIIIKGGTAEDQGIRHFVVVATGHGRIPKEASHGDAGKSYTHKNRLGITSKTESAESIPTAFAAEIEALLQQTDSISKQTDQPQATVEIFDCGFDEILYSRTLYPADRDNFTFTSNE